MLKNQPIVKSTLALMIIAGVAKLLGYVEKVVLAYYYGTGIEVDAFVMVFSIVFSIFVFFRELIEPGFLNVFLRIRKEGEEPAAWNFFNSVGRRLFIPALLIAVLGVAFPGKVVDIFAPGFAGAKRDLAVELVRLSFPAVVFLAMSNLTFITLNAGKSFVLPSLGDVVFKGVILVSLILLNPKMGIAGAGLGIVAGAVLKLLTHLLGLWKNVTLRRTKASLDHYREMWKLTWPLLVGMIFSQSNLLVDNLFASYMTDGSIAALSYSKKLVEMPVIVFPYVLGIVVFPYFSQLAIENNLEKLKRLFYTVSGWISFVFLPLSVFFFVFSTPLVAVLLQRGAFNAESTAQTAIPLAIYSLGMCAFAIETVLVLLFYAMADTKTPTIVGIVCVVINLAITIALIQQLGYIAIALSLVISKTLKVISLLVVLKKKISLDMKPVTAFLAKLLGATLVLVVCLYGLRSMQPHFTSGLLANKKAYLGISIFAGLLVYTAACYLFKMKPLLRVKYHD